MLGKKPGDLISSVFVHELAVVESSQIGENTRVWAFCHVMKGSTIGANCNICEHVFIESGAKIGNGVTVKNQISIWDKVVIEDDTFLGPNVVFTNDMNPRSFIKKSEDEFSPTTVKKGATLGAGSVIVCGNTIGEYAFVAAGSVVTKDVPEFKIVQGNPARIVGNICRCAKTMVKKGQIEKNCSSCDTLVPGL
jgi:acetyltransferase-like isoleucine patch superfamily enzyme